MFAYECENSARLVGPLIISAGIPCLCTPCAKSIFAFQCQLFGWGIYELQRLRLIIELDAEKFDMKHDIPVKMFSCQRFALIQFHTSSNF
jgi:hypothetical protein